MWSGPFAESADVDMRIVGVARQRPTITSRRTWCGMPPRTDRLPMGCGDPARCIGWPTDASADFEKKPLPIRGPWRNSNPTAQCRSPTTYENRCISCAAARRRVTDPWRSAPGPGDLQFETGIAALAVANHLLKSPRSHCSTVSELGMAGSTRRGTGQAKLAALPDGFDSR